MFGHLSHVTALLLRMTELLLHLTPFLLRMFVHLSHVTALLCNLTQLDTPNDRIFMPSDTALDPE